MQANSINSSKQRRTRIWFGCFVLFLGLPFLLYFGYCWGLWGRHNLLLQYYFQCKCPVASEEARYQKEAEVIVSACRNFSVVLSPNGRRLFVQETNSEFSSDYLLDIQTRERIPIQSHGEYFLFLTDDILFRQDGETILDGLTGKEYPITTFKKIQPNAYRNGYANPSLLASALLQADRVFLLDKANYPVIALSSDFQDQPESNFVIYFYELEGMGVDRLEPFLQQNNISYYKAPPTSIWDSFPEEAISPDGRLIARQDGIYLIEDNRRIVKSVPRLLVRGWTSDGRHVLYSSTYIEPCLFRWGLPMGDGTKCEVVVPQPVLLLKVPEAYLSRKE